MIDLTTILIGVVVFILIYLYRKAQTPSCLPPGPKGWPFIGHLDLIHYGQDRHFHVETAKWGQQYDGLYNMQIAQYPTIMVTDLDLLKEMLIDRADEWSDRPLHNSYFKLVQKHQEGVMFTNGEDWKPLRRLTMQSMRDFGVGKKSIEDKIKDELMEVFKEIDSRDGAFEFNSIFNRAVANIICNVLFGDRYSYDDPKYQELVHGMNFMFKNSGFQNIFIFLPFYTFWLMPIVKPQVRELFKISQTIQQFIYSNIKEHRETYDPKNIRDFVDMYIQAGEQEDNTMYSEKKMFGTIMDLFMAGTETTSTTLLWTILFLVKHPEIQQKCREEILQKVGNSRLPTYQDKADLPYVDATLSEVLRLGNTAPVVFTHNTSKTTTLRGYTIPKDTIFLFNLYAIHTDPKHWENPKEFHPERFLDENGAYKRNEAFVPFGLGRRACLGENLARMELFLFATALLQRYEFQAEDITKLPSVDNTHLGVTLIPDQYLVKALKLE